MGDAQQPHGTSPQSLRCWLALLHTPGVGPATFQQILGVFPDPQILFDQPRLLQKEALQKIGLKLPSKALSYLKHPNWANVDNDLRWAEGEQCHILTLADPRYPTLLKEITDPPPVLYVRGNPAVLSQAQLAIVGSRNPSAGGKQTAHDFAHSLALNGLCITSGLALGIDAASHLGALEAGGATIAVAGTGLDRIYPARHRDLGHRIVEQGAIVSEFPPGAPPIASNFPRRNRIISGLSLGVLVVEAALKSGSLITARLASEQGREVFAIPGSIHNPLTRGCHALIGQGAKLTENTHDILEELGPLATLALENQPITDSPTHTASPSINDHPLLESLGFEAVSIDTLVDRSGLTAEAVSSMLLIMELQGIVASSGGLYSRIN